MRKWGPLIILAAAQFVMALDQAVMNVSIGQLTVDLHTTVTSIQGVITLYSLVMAMCMITGGKIGDLIGRRKAFIVGLVIYASGSAVTAASKSVFMLGIGWSGLEGIGAALVLPALAALIAGNYENRDRVVAYSVIGGVSGAAIAVGPILGGWATTALSWRVVFVGEVIMVAIILVFVRLLSDAPRPGRAPHLDGVGAVLSAAGLGLIVVAILNASTWGWVQPKNSPVTIFGFSLTFFVVAAGAAVLYCFVKWQQHRTRVGRDPLVHLELFKIDTLRSGLETFLGQMLILMGVFFTIPLYLQLVLGLDALQTGIRMLPVSIAMFVLSVVGARLAGRFSTRSIVQSGLIIVVLSTICLLLTIRPTLSSVSFAIAMTGLGAGMGLVASQLGNVIQSSVDASGRSEAGGLQYTAQQLGAALGVALIGAVVLSGLVNTFVRNVNADPQISAQVAHAASTAATGSVSFVPASAISQAATAAGLDPTTVHLLVSHYEEAQLSALKVGLLAAAAIGAITLAFTAKLPSKRPVREALETT